MGQLGKSVGRPKMQAAPRVNLLTNPELAGSVGGSPGTAPTGWTFGSGTGTSTEDGTAADGTSKILSQSGTAQRPFLQQATAAMAVGDVMTQRMEIESLVSGTPTFIDMLSRTGTATCTTVYYINDIVRAASTAIATGDRLRMIFTCTGAGTNFIRAGLGCNGNITAAVKFSRPRYVSGS